MVIPIGKASSAVNIARMRRYALFGLLGGAAAASASGAISQPPQATALEEVVVSGAQPGPGLWKVMHDEHLLYVMGSLSPLPANMRWRSAQVEKLVATSQQVIAGRIDVKGDGDIGVFQGLRLLRAALRARAIPEGRRLQDILPPDTYARWAVAKQRWLPGNDRVERWRPMFAGGELYQAAQRRSGLGDDVVWPAIERAARAHKVPIRQPGVTLHMQDPGGLIRDFTALPMSEDIRCLESLLLSVERDLPREARRANAWATGDIEALRADPPEDSRTTCIDALSSSPRIAKQLADAQRAARQEWLLAAEGALLRNPQSVAVLPMREILAPDGLLAQLASRGYRVQAPGP
jgi:TraB/PrgY/gumN family